MKDIKIDNNLIAYCGLYCGACGAYLKGKCLGCSKNEKAGWCNIRKCCIENKYLSCADCKTFANAADCKKFNNLISKIIGLVTRSNRAACIRHIKDKGYEEFAKYMASYGLQSIRKT